MIRQMKNFIVLVLLLTSTVSACFADDPLRIQKLLPDNLLVAVAIAPALPNDFIAMNPNGKLDAYEWTYWGPKEVLESYFKDENSLTQSIIRVKLGTTTQTEIENPNREEWINSFRQYSGFEGFQDIHLKWGSYPVYAIKAKFPEQILFIAWVGLNDPGDWALNCQLVYPRSRCKPTVSDVNLWKNFLSKTEQLTGKLYMKALGQNMEEGCTVVDLGKAKLKVIAERRKSDNKLQLAMIPLEENVSFEFHKANQGSWENMPTAEIQGTLTKRESQSTLIIDHRVLVLIKDVQEFSINKEAVDGNARVVFYHE